MKKLYTLLAMLLSCFLLTSCSNSIDEDALHTYIEARNQISEMKSASVSAKMLVDAKDLGVYGKVSMNGSYNASKKLQMAMHVDAAANGIGLNDLAKVYYKDDALYVNVMDSEKLCLPMRLGELWNISFDKQHEASEADIKELFDELSMESADDKKIITGAMKDEGLKNAATTANSFLIGYTYDSKENMRIKEIHDANCILTVNAKNQFEKMVIKMTASYEYSDENEDLHTTSMNIEMQLDFKDINRVDHIEFPSFKDYVKTDHLTKEADDFIQELEGENAI